MMTATAVLVHPVPAAAGQTAAAEVPAPVRAKNPVAAAEQEVIAAALAPVRAVSPAAAVRENPAGRVPAEDQVSPAVPVKGQTPVLAERQQHK